MGELQFFESSNNLYLDSRDVADMIGKEHKNLLADIRGYIVAMLKFKDKNGKLNFQPTDFFIESSYLSSQNKKLPCFQLTKKGCEMVANKMIGDKGVIFTATYVTKFEEMENELKALHQPSYMIDDPIKRAERWIAEQKEKQQIETKNLMLEQQLAEAEPKVTYYDKILSSPGTVTVTQIAKDYGLSAAKLNRILHEERVQYKQSRQWFLYSNYADKGYTKSETHIDGTGEPRMNTKWTQKGRLFIHQLLNNIGINAIEDEE
jgi:Rha family phage regulatory protein